MTRLPFGTALLALAACLGLATPLHAAPKPVKIALFVAIQANPVEQSIIETFKQVAEKDGAATLVVFDSNNSVQKELANCNDAIAAGTFDAFALKAVAGPPLMACARAAIEAKIPVVVFGNALGPDPNTAARQIPGLAGSVIELAQTNGRAIAALVDQACVARGKSPCNVAYAYGPLAFDWASISRKSFEEAVAKDHPNIRIVATGLNDFNPETARTLTKTLLQTHPELDVVATDVDFAAAGAIAALKDVGKVPGRDVLVTGAALSNQGKELIAKGELFGSTCLMPRTEAKTAAEYAILAARHEPIAASDIEVCRAFAKTGVLPITVGNLDQFTSEW